MIAAGFGFRKEASSSSLEDAYGRACEAAAPEVLATVDDKAVAEAFRLFAEELGLPVKAVPVDVLQEQETTTQSAASKARYGAGSVAEAAALAAAGPGARLLTVRQISADKLATCALAIRETS
ncbi:cobalamin biosynthesis protein [Roseobacter sinensis]|uniref:Cobalamin biosynthesis protein n=1 Tax=Roseobacter sinensis TaxID=2931391 RepID=A0ABT3BCS9_9RHOB|nr:cobalamin biosynthesis protein [Roseobacter sp. WL0113]MCV3271384.1 cobalamin biosynthesis protein [Roseobacter sp. WL0113]